MKSSKSEHCVCSFLPEHVRCSLGCRFVTFCFTTIPTTASVGGEAAAGRVSSFLFLFYSVRNFFFTKLYSLALFHSSVAFFVWLAGGSASFKSSLYFFLSHVTKVKVLYRKCTILCSSKNCACMASTSQCSIQFASSLVNRWMDW